MKYDLFCSDFDGTLAASDNTVSQINKNAIARYLQAGGIFAVCTGRSLDSALPRAREAGLTQGLLIAFQGATIADIATGKLLKDDCFPPERALKAIRAMEKRNLHVHVYTVEGFYSNMQDDLLALYEKMCGVTAEVVTKEPLSDFVKNRALRIVKVLAMVQPPQRHALREELARELSGDYFVTCSSEWLVEIMPAGQNKGAAVDFLSEYYKIPKEKIAAIGDQLNDLPMLEHAGGKFAVQNGQEELKKIAVTVSSNDENGVAEAILKYAMEIVEG
jgi:hypothetical protein